jgi:hypothetical protein
VKEWIIEGKYTTGLGSEWEEIDTVSESDPEGARPGEPTGYEYAKYLVGEYRTAHAPHPVRMRPKRATD